MRLDLHAHTTFSDGDMTPREVAALAKSIGLHGVAITDHDECRGFAELAPTPDLVQVPGIEIAASEEGPEIHVLGLDVDCCHQTLTDYVVQAVEKRHRRARAAADKLQAAGYDVSIEDIERECRGCALGRPHIALALIRKGYATSVDDAFTRFVSRGTPFYVPMERVTVAQAATIILQAGGKPVLAHPGLLKPGAFDALAPRLKDMGFWGLEAYHPSHSDGQCRIYESEARRLGLFVTSGSDFHGALGDRAALGSETRGGAYLRRSQETLMGSLRHGV
jgi:predicted metal-dependent phosphoesterase TrpH